MPVAYHTYSNNNLCRNLCLEGVNKEMGIDFSQVPIKLLVSPPPTQLISFENFSTLDQLPQLQSLRAFLQWVNSVFICEVL